MHRADRRRRRSSGSGLEQTNGDCGGEVNPTGGKASQQSNGSVPLHQSEADNRIEETPNVGNENGHLHEETVEKGKGVSNGFSGEEEKPTPVTGKKRSGNRSSGPHRELVLGLPCKGQFEIFRSRNAATSSKRLGSGGGERNVQLSSHKRAQRSKEEAVVANPTPVDRPRPKKRKKGNKKGKVVEDDEYTRIKKKLRYLLNRINYEQSLIDAYSLEGWKGSSMEKLRPEKELERATKEILRRKVKIRDLFQHLDTLCAEGSLPESLFDSDGKISSEDIFCAKCGSEDLSADNDIILCDGFCDRGFHQNCVEPPLRKEDIPPDDESWLCPACDCKDDSFVLLNDSLGTKLSVSDSWEKVFPEAAAAMAGGDQNLNCDLPSDDSDDEEYAPDGLNDDENDEDGSDDSDESEKEDGSSDESDFSSASDEMIASLKETKDIMALPSDDSEDDDYDPDAPVQDEDKTQGSSNSDCSSDSEDLETSLNGDESNQTPRGKPGRKKSQLPDVSSSEADDGLDQDLEDAPGRRKVERLDYKKLYDEEYENVPTSSSDDEDWDKTAGKEDYESGDEMETVPLKQSSKAEDHTSTKKPREKLKRANNKDNSLKAPQQEASRENGYSGGKSSSSANKQRLLKSFEENRYPDITTREGLAKELQMTVKQVTTWFVNTRFSTSKKMVSEEVVDKLKAGKEGEGETSVAGSSDQVMETEAVTENKSRALESTNTRSSKRMRR